MPGKFRDASVVELGGAVSKFLVDLSLLEGATVTAIDYSDVGVQQTRQLFKDMGVTGEVLQADIFAMHAGEKTYDIVTHWGLLEHFSEPRAVLKACHGLLRADGLVVFSMPNMEAYGAGLWRLLAPDNYSAHVHHSSEVVAKACSDVGLQLEREFFCGPPLIRMAPAERLRIVAILVDLLHSFVLLIGLVAPSMYLRGARKISNTRGFVARRVVNPS
ncbi:MAG: class I SAM-dependent methyltransferase [Proteobacteria bacterium]|nr:class I SAM-dependent methyltransferase [Pseudomonadota bacterium]